MGSTFGGFEISKRGLSAHQAAITVTGHNISNADNPNYARQRVAMEAADAIYDPSLNRAAAAGQIGQGVNLTRIERVRDQFYDDQIAAAGNVKGYFEAQSEYLRQIEQAFNEPSDSTIRATMEKFWASWQDLSNYPADMAHREVVLERGKALTSRINDTYVKLANLRERANAQVLDDVDQINGLAVEVRELNEKILKLQALGDSPNDLMDRRDAAIERLSTLANVNIGRGDKDELFVFIGEQALVQGTIVRQLRPVNDPENDGLWRVEWAHNDQKLILDGGHLAGLLHVRDDAISTRIDATDELAVNLADIVNEVHRDGFGLDGQTNRNFFEFKSVTDNADGRLRAGNSRANVDLNGDGSEESTALFRVTGKNRVDPKKPVGIEGTIRLSDKDDKVVEIPYQGDDTPEEIIKRINDQKLSVVAYLNHDNQIAFKAAATGDKKRNFILRHIEDSGEFLVGFAGILQGSGAAAAYDYRRIDELSKFRGRAEDAVVAPGYHPASHLAVAEAVGRNPAIIAAARGKDQNGVGEYEKGNPAGDGNNALQIASSLKQASRMIGHSPNPEEFYNSLIAKLGAETRVASDMVQHQKDNLTQLNSLRQSVMGVNLDEEMSNMVQFQQSYNAAARVMNTMNEMLELLINRLGA